MPPRIRRFVWIAASLVVPALLYGCAAPTSPPVETPKNYDPEKAFLTLAEIQPPVSIPQAATPATQPDVPPAARRFFRAGRDRFNEELWGEAINELARALQVAPGMVEARILLARASLLQGNLALALTHLEEALKQRPDDAAVHQLLGDIAWQARDLDAARDHFRRALLCPNAAPDRPETILAHLFLGLTLREQGYLSAAAAELRTFLDAVEGPDRSFRGHPELRQVVALFRARAASELADACERLGNHADAVAALRRGLELAPTDRDLRIRLARALLRADQPAEALDIARDMCLSDDGAGSALDLLLEIATAPRSGVAVDNELLALGRESRNPALLLRLAGELADRGKPADAAAILKRAVDLQPDNVDVRLRLASIAIDLGDAREFIAQLVGALRNRKDAWEPVAQLLADNAGNPAGRRILIDAARDLAGPTDDRDPAALLLLGRLLILDDRVDEAAAVLAEAVDVDPALGAAYVALAELRLSRNLLDAAIAACDRAVAAGVREATIFRVKAAAHEALDQFDEAEKAYTEATNINRNDEHALLGLAQLCQRRGEAKRAVQLLRRIVQTVNSRNFEARETLARIFIKTGNPRGARQQLNALKRLEAPPVVVGRLDALFKAATDDSLSGPERIHRYRDELTALLDRFPDDVETRMDLAGIYEGMQDFDAALACLDELLARRPDYLPAREQQVDLLAQALRFDEAKARIESMLRQRPRNVGWLARLAEISLDAGDYRLAAESFRKLLALDERPEVQPRYRQFLIFSLELMGDQDGAIASAEEWLRGAPKDPNRRAIFLRELDRAGRLDDAIDAVRRWLQDDTGNVNTRFLLAEQLQRAGRHAEAQQQVLAWLAADTDAESLNHLMIQTLLRARRWDAAIELIHTATDEPGADADYETLLLRAYLASRRFNEAVQYYQRLVRETPDERLEYNLLTLYMAARQYADAEALANKLLQPHLGRLHAGVPFNKEELAALYRQLASIYQNTGRHAKCIETLDKIYELSPNDAGINNDLGYTLADAGEDLPRAEKMIRYAVGQAPRNAAYLDSLGWALYKRSDFDGALRFLRKAVAFSDTPDAVILEHLGDALHRTGQRDEALENWKKALDIAGDPQRNIIPSEEDDRVAERCRRKIGATAAGDPVEPAPLADPARPSPASPAGRSDGPKED